MTHQTADYIPEYLKMTHQTADYIPEYLKMTHQAMNYIPGAVCSGTGALGGKAGPRE